MPFGNDLSDIFSATVATKAKINEIVLFRSLAEAACLAASRNGYHADLFEIHKTLVNFEEMPGRHFYRAGDRGECVPCELADLMLILYNQNEARLCFMQNKYDKRPSRSRNFKADTRQLYVLKNRPLYWRGRRHDPTEPAEDILHNARYSSITSYGVFARDNNNHYTMEYYNADAIMTPACTGKACVVTFDRTYDEYSTIDNLNDQLNYAFTLTDFGQGVENMMIGEKFNSLDALLCTINVEEVINFFRNRDATNVDYDPTRKAILAKCIVMINFQNRQNG